MDYYIKKMKQYLEKNLHKDLANKAGLKSSNIIGMYLRKERFPSDEVAIKIAKAIGADEKRFLLSVHEANTEPEAKKYFSYEENLSQMASARTTRIPVLNHISCGMFKPSGDLDYPPGEADDDFLGIDPLDESAFGLVAQGDSMSPMINQGDIVVVSPNRELISGDVACIIKGNESTIKVFEDKGSFIVLRPINPNYEVQILDKKEAEKLERENKLRLYPVVSIVKRLK